MADEYQNGFCDGWKAAANAVWENRNHNRALVGFAPETQEDVMKRIYSSWSAPHAPRMKGGQYPVPKELGILTFGGFLAIIFGGLLLFWHKW